MMNHRAWSSVRQSCSERVMACLLCVLQSYFAVGTRKRRGQRRGLDALACVADLLNLFLGIAPARVERQKGRVPPLANLGRTVPAVAEPLRDLLKQRRTLLVRARIGLWMAHKWIVGLLDVCLLVDGDGSQRIT